MCDRCQRVFKEAVEEANDHMDAEGIPEDSLARGLVQVELLCNMHPDLAKIMATNYPNATALMQ